MRADPNVNSIRTRGESLLMHDHMSHLRKLAKRRQCEQI